MFWALSLNTCLLKEKKMGEHKHTRNPPPGDSQRKTDEALQGLHDLSTQEGGFTMFVYIHKLVDSVSTYKGRRKLGTGALETILPPHPVTSSTNHPFLPRSVKHISNVLCPFPITQTLQGF